MAASGDLINFDIIEGQKENIQALPSGRSAKKLAEIYSPSPLHKLSTPTPSDTRTVNDCIRAEYEAEVQTLSESDDPLDIFDRYVRWTLDAYPSAQATPQSQLHTLLERATKAFITSAQYKNDPRYLKMWIHYIHFFADSPRETYVFLSRHSIGEGLALFYEEYAAWLEGARRWAQAEEVYKLGIEREARPVQRLLRKFKEFEERRSQQSEEVDEPSSPALPAIRPALAAKLNPFAAAARPADPQAQQLSGGSGTQPKAAKSKLAVFSDADSKPSAMSSRDTGSKGWDTIGSLAERKKENVMEPKPWVGETLQAGGKKVATTKMSVFRDSSLARINNIVVVPSKNQVTVHPQTGKRERIYVNLTEVYPTPEEPGTELSFEEIIAWNRGWLDRSWEEDSVDVNVVPGPAVMDDVYDMSNGICQKLVIHKDPILVDENNAVMERPQQPKGSRKKKIMDFNETQIIKAKLDSPSGPKLRKRSTAEPTMTIHTKAATDDIYEIFNAPLKPVGRGQDDDSADDDDYETDGDYTTDAESTGTNRHIDSMEPNNNDNDDGNDDNALSDEKSVSEWSDFSPEKPVPNLANGDNKAEEDEQYNLHTPSETPAAFSGDENEEVSSSILSNRFSHGDEPEEVETPEMQTMASTSRTVFVPIPPENYDPPTRPYRDPVEVANNRLPFMTPITERTEYSINVEAHRVEQTKTPCRRDATSITTRDDDISSIEPLSSPLRDIVSAERFTPGKPASSALAMGVLPRAVSNKAIPHKGPIIQDKQCNPVDDEVRDIILSNAHPPLATMRGFYNHHDEDHDRGSEIRKFAKGLVRSSKGGSEKTGPAPSPVILEFSGASSTYTIKRELGAGAFAPVYMVQNSHPQGENDENAVAIHPRSDIEALKMESPPTPWEFYMMRLAHSRLGLQHRAVASLSYAHEMHLYRDEAYLFLPYHPHGTLLDVINLFRAEPSGAMDEQLAMFFSIELLRTVEALHTKNILHGDLKPDNCLLRLDNLLASTSAQQVHHTVGSEALSSQWQRNGNGGWHSRGITLIDFGRAIDMRAFVPEVQFIADWKTTAQDCAEMREGRPWTWQIDYHGLAGIIHCLLFGKYIETMRCDQGGLGKGGRKYRIRESLKRYWQTELWHECFELLLNPGSFVHVEEGGNLPILRSMRAIRERMEDWLETKSDKGVGLKSLIGKLDCFARSRR